MTVIDIGIFSVVCSLIAHVMVDTLAWVTIVVVARGVMALVSAGQSLRILSYKQCFIIISIRTRNFYI